MSSSYVEYRTFGFWARDGALEVWLYLLGIAARDLPSAPPWLLEAAAHWKEQSIGGYTGTIAVHLDEYLLDQSRIDVVRNLAQRQLLWLRERESLSAEWLNSLHLGGPGNSHFPADAPCQPFLSVGEAFVALLNGQLKSTAEASAIIPDSQPIRRVAGAPPNSRSDSDRTTKHAIALLPLSASAAQLTR